MKKVQNFGFISLKNIFLFFGLAIVFGYSSCVHHLFYSPALQGQDMSYQYKPMQSDSVKTNYYFSLIKGEHSAANLIDGIKFTELNGSVGHVLGGFNLAYSFSGLFGKYTNHYLGVLDPDYFQYKRFGAYCFRTSANYINRVGNFEFRFPGLEFSYSKERGDFPAYRRYQTHQAHYFSNANTKLFTAGFSYELIWHRWRKQYKQYSLKVIYSKTLNAMSYKADTLHTEVGGFDKQIYITSSFKYKNLGFSMSTTKTGLKLGLIYSVK